MMEGMDLAQPRESAARGRRGVTTAIGATLTILGLALIVWMVVFFNDYYEEQIDEAGPLQQRQQQEDGRPAPEADRGGPQFNF